MQEAPIKPFKITEPMASLQDTYPNATRLLDTAHNGGPEARTALAQLWLTEGIPYAFRKCPAIYDAVRSWLSVNLDVHPKEISIIGSARIGESLAPEKVGQKFTNESDLDLFIVSKKLFNLYQNEFTTWSDDYRSGKIKPRNDNEKGYWKDHENRGPKIIDRGFIDVKMIPIKGKYQMAQKTHNCMWKLTEKLKITPRAPMPKRASVRCYADWSNLIRQILRNLKPDD